MTESGVWVLSGARLSALLLSTAQLPLLHYFCLRIQYYGTMVHMQYGAHSAAIGHQVRGHQLRITVRVWQHAAPHKLQEPATHISASLPPTSN